MPTNACSPEAEEEIRSIVTNAKDKHSGYWINRRYFFMGKALKYAYFPNWNLRLFKHKLGRYEKITDLPTDSGDHEIHEHVVVQGSTGKLKSIMDHHAFPTIESFVEKHNRYSNWEAIIENEQKEKADSIQHDWGKTEKKIKDGFSKTSFSTHYTIFICIHLAKRISRWMVWLCSLLDCMDNMNSSQSQRQKK
jgi:hypothetical protein